MIRRQALGGAMGTIAPLHPQRVMQVVIRRTEVFLGEFRDFVRVVVFAREDVEVDGVRLVGIVTRDERGLDELSHRESGDALVFAEVDDRALAKPFHPDALAELVDMLFDLVRVTDGLWGAPMQIYRGEEAPCAPCDIVSANDTVIPSKRGKSVNVRPNTYCCLLHF